MSTASTSVQPDSPAGCAPPPQRGAPRSPLSPSLLELPTASPELLASRALQKRIDTKFALPEARLAGVLASLGGRYAVVRVGGAPLDRYETTYLDTSELLFLDQHLRDRRPRYKVRIRRYVGRERSYLEVKQKTPADTTRKWRLELPFDEPAGTPRSSAFLDAHCPVSASELRPTAGTHFDRIMLVGLDTLERVTLDLHLTLVAGARRRALEGCVIVEVKQDRRRVRTPIMLALRAHQVRPLSISKYCAAAALLLEGARVQRYRPRMRELQRIVSRSESRA